MFRTVLKNSIALKELQGNEVKELKNSEVYAEATVCKNDNKEKKLTLYMALV